MGEQTVYFYFDADLYTTYWRHAQSKDFCTINKKWASGEYKDRETLKYFTPDISPNFMLIYACLNGHVDKIEFALNCGANPTLTCTTLPMNKQLQTPVDLFKRGVHLLAFIAFLSIVGDRGLIEEHKAYICKKLNITEQRYNTLVYAYSLKQ